MRIDDPILLHLGMIVSICFIRLSHQKWSRNYTEERGGSGHVIVKSEEHAWQHDDMGSRGFVNRYYHNKEGTQIQRCRTLIRKNSKYRSETLLLSRNSQSKHKLHRHMIWTLHGYQPMIGTWFYSSIKMRT